MQVPHPAGGRASLGVKGRPYFASRGQMASQLEHLASHCVTPWQQRLRPPHVAFHPTFLVGSTPRLQEGVRRLGPINAHRGGQGITRGAGAPPEGEDQGRASPPR